MDPFWIFYVSFNSEVNRTMSGTLMGGVSHESFDRLFNVLRAPKADYFFSSWARNGCQCKAIVMEMIHFVQDGGHEWINGSILLFKALTSHYRRGRLCGR